MRLIIPFLIIVLLGSCANPYTQFYTDLLYGKSPTEIQTIVVTKESPRIYRGSDNRKQDGRALRENGYLLIGYSAYNGTTSNTDQLKAHAQKVGAAVVITYTSYTDTISGTMPYTVKNPPQTSTTSHSGGIYGSGGYATYSGSSTTTSSGDTTTYNIPYSARRYDFVATYWVKYKPLPFGASFTDLTPEVRSQLERNRGAIIDVVVKNSPAFDADFLPGDIIIAVDNVEIRDSQALVNILISKAGWTVHIRFIRRGKERSVKVRLREKSY